MAALSVGLWLAFALSAGEVHETWEGVVRTEFIERHHRGRRADRWGDEETVTLRIARKGNQFTGEWIEGKRVLKVAGSINGRRMHCRPVRVIQGKWPDDVLRTLQFDADVKKNEMRGGLSGYGDRRATSGSFELKRK